MSALSPEPAKTLRHSHQPKLDIFTLSLGPYFLSSAFLPLLVASKSKAPYGDKFEPQIINTVSMNGWTKVRGSRACENSSRKGSPTDSRNCLQTGPGHGRPQLPVLALQRRDGSLDVVARPRFHQNRRPRQRTLSGLVRDGESTPLMLSRQTTS